MKLCDKTIKELLPLYADGELTKEEKALVDAHILDCSECNEELELYQMMHDEFFLGDVEAPEGFHEDLMNRLDIAKSVQKKSLTITKPSLYKRYNKYINVAAMLVFVMLLSVIGLTQGNKWSDSYNSTMMDTATESTFSAEMAEAKEESAEAISEENMRMGVNSVEETQDALMMEAPQEDMLNAEIFDGEADDKSAVIAEKADADAVSVQVTAETLVEAGQLNPDTTDVSVQASDVELNGSVTGETADTVNEELTNDALYGDAKDFVESEESTSYTLLVEGTDPANKEKTAKILVEPQGEQDYTALTTQSPPGPSWTLIVGGILLGLCLVIIIIFLIRKNYFKK